MNKRMRQAGREVCHISYCFVPWAREILLCIVRRHKMSGAEDAFSMRKGDEKMGDEIIAK